MIKSLQFSLLLMFLTSALKGQTIGITQVQNETNSVICLGKKVLVSYSKTGTFNPDNIFKLQIKSSYSSTWTSLETKDSSGYLVAVLPLEIPNLISTSSYDNCDYRIVSSSPNLISNSHSYQSVYSLAKVELTGVQKNTISTNELAIINVNVNGSNPIEVLMSDSTFVKLNMNNLTQSALVAPNKTGNYSILSVSNICGIGKGSGSVNVKIIDNSLKIIDIVNSEICKNGKINIHAIKSGKWTASNKFTIRLTNRNSTTKYFYDFDAAENEGIFSANIGTIIPYDTYNVKLLASDNGVESDEFTTSIYVHNESKVELITSSRSIRYGEYLELVTRLSGYGNHSIELSNGQKLNSYINGDYYATNPTFIVTPQESTEYFIKSFTSGCGIGTGKNKVMITVDKGIKTDSVKAGNYCEGTTCEVKFSTNTSLPVGSPVKVRMMNGSGLFYDDYKDVDATVIRDNVVSFVIPTKLNSFFKGHKFYVSVFTDNISPSNLSPNFITVSTFPSAIVGNSSSIVVNLKKPQVTDIELILKGGEPYEITMTDSLKYKYNNEEYYWENTTYLPVFIPKTSVVAVKSITNVCGTNNAPYSTYKYVTIENAEYSIRIISSKTQSAEVCVGEKLDLSLLTNGKYGNDNQFTVELISNYSSSYNKNLGTITVAKPQITIPNDVMSGEYNLRVSSSNPLIYSNLFPVSVKKLPSAEYLTNSLNVISGGRIYTTLRLSGGGSQTLTYKDGYKEIIKPTNGDGSYYEQVEKIIDKTTTFGLQSISNVCGVGTVKSNDFTVTTIPYTIENRLIESYSHCIKDKIMVPFRISGTGINDDSFSIQIASNIDTNFTTLQSGIKESPAYVALPSNFKEGKYKIRIVNNNNSIKSETVTINFRSTPNVALQLYGGGNLAEIEAGSYVNLRSNNTLDNISYPWTNPFRYVIKDDKNIKTIGINDYNYINDSRFPLVTTTYTLISAINECGQGNVSGSVKVIVKPILDMDFKSMDYNANFCVGSKADIVINSKGYFETDNSFKVFALDENNIKTELFKTNKNGNYKIAFGNELKKGVYKIQMESSNPYQVKDIKTIFITSKADVTLFGQPIINKGDGAYIIIKNNDIYKFNSNNYFSDVIFYELSNGLTGSIDLNNNNYGNYTGQIYVNPSNTQTYAVKSVTNVCGTGKADGSATITVNQPSMKYVSIYQYQSNLCQGSVNNIYFSTVGTFTATNKFTVQITDNTGKNFIDLETEGTVSPLQVKFPSNLVLGTGYYIRVVASDKNSQSNTNSNPYTIREGVTARFDTSSYYFSSNKPVVIHIKLSGIPPFNFSIGSDEINAKQYNNINTNIYPITVNPTANTAYRLFSVSNQVCGTGTILSPLVVRLELITGTEELNKLGINVFPNPTSDIININSDSNELDIQLIDFSGKVVHEERLKGENKQLDLSKISSGAYFLHIQKEGKQAVFKVIKQ